MQELAPYELSVEILQAIIAVAATSDVLIFGELHCTQEVPRLVLSLLEALATTGYRGLALQIPFTSCHASYFLDATSPVDHFFNYHAPAMS